MHFLWKKVEAAALRRQSSLHKEVSSTLLSYNSEHTVVTEASSTKKSISVLPVKGTSPTKQKLCSSYTRAVFTTDAYFKQRPDGKASHA